MISPNSWSRKFVTVIFVKSQLLWPDAKWNLSAPDF